MFPTARISFQQSDQALGSNTGLEKQRYPLFPVACLIYFDYDIISIEKRKAGRK